MSSSVMISGGSEVGSFASPPLFFGTLGLGFRLGFGGFDRGFPPFDGLSIS
jgi:hypothetical protein